MPASKPKPNRKRSERLCLGLTPAEKNMISTAAKEAGMSQTDFLVASVKGTRIVVITALPELLLELSRQGNNLNQVTRCLNGKHSVSQFAWFRSFAFSYSRLCKQFEKNAGVISILGCYTLGFIFKM